MSRTSTNGSAVRAEYIRLGWIRPTTCDVCGHRLIDGACPMDHGEDPIEAALDEARRVAKEFGLKGSERAALLADRVRDAKRAQARMAER